MLRRRARFFSASPRGAPPGGGPALTALRVQLRAIARGELAIAA
jgi:hypothetical protein